MIHTACMCVWLSVGLRANAKSNENYTIKKNIEDTTLRKKMWTVVILVDILRTFIRQ